MICKEDVVCWFKELESYERIDTMCTLLNMCLPFELRFLGTCLEELGRRDSQELRGIELRVNNPVELAADISSCRAGDPTDIKIRRRMALYLALIRVSNRSSVTEIFQTLEVWGDKDFFKFGDGDPLQELLLVYTMAANHPVFSFEQRMKCGEIYNKINECTKVLEGPRHTDQHNFNQTSSVQPQQQISTQNLTNSMSSPPPSSHPHQLNQQPIPVLPVLPMGFNTMTQMLPPDSNLTSPMTVDGITQMIPHGLSLNHDFALSGPWGVRHGMMHASYPPPSLEAMSMSVPRSSSPMSQPSSPVPSRTSSPTRNSSLQQIVQQPVQQQHPHRSSSHQQRASPSVIQRSSRRPSDDKTPPPQQQSHQQQQHHIANSNDSSIQHNTKNYDEMVLNVDGAISQLKSIYQNGYIRQNHHTIPRQSNKSSYLHHQHHHNMQQHHQQQQQQQHASNYNQNAMNFTLQKAKLDVNSVMENHTNADSGRQKSIESDSGGSSVESVPESPPTTPMMTTNMMRHNIKEQRGKTSSRQNGRADKLGNTVAQHMFVPNHQPPPYSMSSSSGDVQQTNLIVNPTAIVTNNIIATTAGMISTQHHISSPTSVCVNSVTTTNPPIMLQQFPAQHLQPQLTATYPYPIQHRSALISHSQSQPPLTHQHTFRHPHPTFQIQPNGDILYPYPPTQTAIAFLQSTPTQTPSNVRLSPSIQSTQQQQQQQQQQSPVVDATPIVAAAYPTQNKMIVSCFNCGSQLHAGRDCSESSMEDVTRAAIYKLDYSAYMASLSEQGASTTMTGSGGSSTLTDSTIMDGSGPSSSTIPSTSSTSTTQIGAIAGSK
ncbi:alpha-protein kinase 1 isoform X2 [Bradysia coprophila]|uniref:alpha-protein kinase 1 isoform X2 n=1 Tax=Bradysia coprophila TaxID=38358 RepID=UPI00187DDA05|nr:alpha-protein kinase 1 isoform X2 [Bradysia coprophila]